MIKLLCAVVLCASTVALAQPAPDEAKKAEAKSLYEEGLKHYNLGEYDAAIESFKRAYAISSAPGLLFNIAQSYRLKKDYEQASNFYLTYLRLKPDAPNRSDVEQRIDEMNKLLEEQKSMEKRPPTGTVTPEGGPTKEPHVTVNINDTRKPAEGSGGGQSMVTAGYATAGAGLALVVTGAVFGQMAKKTQQELDDLNAGGGTWTQEMQDKYDTGKRNNTIAVIAFIAGGAAVATGATLWVMGTLRNTASHVAIAPTKGGANVAFTWSF